MACIKPYRYRTRAVLKTNKKGTVSQINTLLQPSLKRENTPRLDTTDEDHMGFHAHQPDTGG